LDHLFNIFNSLVSFKVYDHSHVLVAHAYNPGYSGGRDQENGGSKPAQANSSPEPISKKTKTKNKKITKKAGGVTQMVQHLHSKCEALSANSIPPKKSLSSETFGKLV
jgi:hypothetical protein